MVHTNRATRWDIFCRVIDNFGDIGVSWRLACQLAGQGAQVRLWVDDAQALRWMAPGGCAGVEVRPWIEPFVVPDDLPPGDVLVEAFGCEVPLPFVGRWVDWRAEDAQRPAWINLEYLSAEAYVERSHALPSPVMSGPARGLTKHFFYPGFTRATGGLLREPDLAQRQAAHDPAAWLEARGIRPAPGQPVVSLFCYEPPLLPDLLGQLARSGAVLLVTPGRATVAVRQVQSKGKCPLPTLQFLPWLTQREYDELLWSCDLNFVRGEDSLVRALWAGRPLVWQLYPQDDGAHGAKLEAFLAALHLPEGLSSWHRRWNGLPQAAGPERNGLPPLPPLPIAGNDGAIEAARWAAETGRRLAQAPDLVTQLCRFVAGIRDGDSGCVKNRLKS